MNLTPETTHLTQPDRYISSSSASVHAVLVITESNATPFVEFGCGHFIILSFTDQWTR